MDTSNVSRGGVALLYIYFVIIKICKKLLENAYMLNSYFSCFNIASLVLLMIN